MKTVKIKFVILIICFLSSHKIINAQETKLTFSDLLNFTTCMDFPADVFSCFEKKGFEFAKKENYNDLFKDIVKEEHLDLSNCNRYYYSKKNCTAFISFCDKLVTDPMMEFSRMITIGSDSPEYFDYLVDKIKVNCVYLKTEDSQYNGIPTKTFYYKHKTGTIFNYHKYLSADNKMEYYIVVKI